MAGKVFRVALVLLSLLEIGCSEARSRNAQSVEAPKTTAMSSVTRMFKCPDNAQEMLAIKDRCFDSLDKRDKTIEEMRERIRQLQEEVKAARDDASDWQRRYVEYQCD